MSPTLFLHMFILIPLLGFAASLLCPKSQEHIISGISFATIGLHFLGFIAFLVSWIIHGHVPFSQRDLVLYATTDYEFYLDFCFDKVTAVYVAVGNVLTLMVCVYSRVY